MAAAINAPHIPRHGDLPNIPHRFQRLTAPGRHRRSRPLDWPASAREPPVLDGDVRRLQRSGLPMPPITPRRKALRLSFAFLSPSIKFRFCWVLHRAEEI
jgi:hypothetical protein